MSDKPVIFISHSSKDRAVAKVLKEELERGLNVRVRHTSDEEEIASGDHWDEHIKKILDIAQGLIVLVSRYSADSQWVQWEIGYFERRMEEQKGLHIFVASIAGAESFKPIYRKQRKSLNHKGDVKCLLTNIESFISPNTSNSWEESVKHIVEKTPTLQINEEDIDILKTYLEYEHVPNVWITYRMLDANKGFPKGTSEKYLLDYIKEFNWEIDIKLPSGVRLKKSTV